MIKYLCDKCGKELNPIIGRVESCSAQKAIAVLNSGTCYGTDLILCKECLGKLWDWLKEDEE